ncbi:DNA-packaging protein FI [Citrobacter sp. S2-9]|uniref:DNA-packaging protein FI n=1 Tax=Citrobacter enshiensis TaxID=2971264 RepID=A0ABT8PRQ2_9ENTR|nr:DNA-packaging protein FI [Citrobacter enshiensis]MDN8599020.1 DNA-packaging protein FI [Citrobacter enshiensis]
MNKAELVARLKELSQKLGRDLSTEGANDVLESRVKEAEAELALLNDDGESSEYTSTDDNAGSKETENGTAGITSLPQSKVDEESNVTRRRVKLYRTLDIWHHKKGVDRRNPNKVVHVREIVSEGEEIDVDADEAAYIIREEHGRAV